ncbi:DUF1515 family protein [Pleomorphomonas oryzae]|uniref:DUF1515 family protein n=1 Tax=Pleomorphomonas oryzae TaxID=261934 RepID=UPI00068629D4|nr:DUF1515 family protein [Pleomorphomonas oryzae]
MMADSEKPPAVRSRSRRRPARQALPKDDISRSLGRIEAGLQYLAEEMRDEKEAAATSRAAVHRRLDEQAALISRLTTDVAIAVNVSAQAREHAKGIEARLDDDVAPTIEEWRKIKNMGLGMAALIGLGGATITSAVWVAITYFGDAIAASLRNMLRIP